MNSNFSYKISFFFFNNTATTEIYTLSLHDALPIFKELQQQWKEIKAVPADKANELWRNYQLYVEQFYDLLKLNRDRKSTRLNSSHANISYAVFCLKKKNNSTSSSIES